MIPKYPKKDKMSRFRTLSLFVEMHKGQDNPDLKPVFTLGTEDKGEHISLRKIYLEISDPTEYEFALHVFGSWQHWDKLRQAQWFRKYLDRWRDELEVKLKSQAVGRMRQISNSPATQALAASKFLIDRGWIDKESKRGRPSKEEKERIQKQDAEVKERVDEDFERVIGSIRGAA
jgi:uncharacterized protein Usg